MNKNTILLFWIFIILFSVTLNSHSQSLCNDKREIPGWFSEGDRVCFVGNSITNSGEFHHNLLLYFITRFPNQKLRFYNCGIAGDLTISVLRRMDEDILKHQPTHAIIMLGMNDVNRTLYGKLPTQNTDTIEMRSNAIEVYKENLANIVTLFLSKNIQVILEKPTIYDQTVVNKTPNNYGVNDAIKTCAGFIDELSTKYKLPTVDYWTIMNQINNDLQKKNSSASLIKNDRVHPGVTGHFVMSYQFLKSIKAPQYVSKMVVSKDEKQINLNSSNCTIDSVYFTEKNATFMVKENSLPFPVVDEQLVGLELVPFTKDFNVQFLQVSGLKNGRYKLFIDCNEIGTFKEEQLSKGINLANYPATPQYKQAIKVRQVLDELWNIESSLRGIKFIEYNKHFQNCPNNYDLKEVKTYLDSVFTYVNRNPYYKLKLNEYLEIKPSENDLILKSEKLKDQAYILAKPIFHQYRIVLNN